MRLGPLCAILWRICDLMCQETSNSQSPTHSRLAECGSRQAIQARPDHQNRVVSPSRGLPINMQQVALVQIGLFAVRFNYKLALFVSLVQDPQTSAVDALSLPWEELDA